MAKKGDKQSNRRKERGLNVRVVQKSKETSRGDVHVNSYQKKSKKTTTKKTAAKKTITKKTTTKSTKTVDNAKTKKKPASFSRNAEPSKKSPFIALPDDESKQEVITKKSSAPVEQITELTEGNSSVTNKKDPIEPELDSTEISEKKLEEKETLEPEIKLPETKAEAKNREATPEPEVDHVDISNFQTLKISRIEEPLPPTSKIITRDVAKEKPLEEINDTWTPAQTKTEKKPALAERIPQKAMSASKQAKQSASEIKEREIERAVKTAAKLPETRNKRTRKGGFNFSNSNWTRAVLAIACATTAIFAVAYFINLTSTDMSLKVAAMQSGIEASYPSYVPRGYSLSDVTSASGKVTMNFVSDEGSFMIVEESSSWDSTALLNNYIKETYGDDYTVVREQGLTLYMGDTWEAWVNGGTLYKLNVTSGSLTKKQMKTIAASL